MKGTITLIGMMGAGKSAVGAELARQLTVPFHDSDTEIERAAAMRPVGQRPELSVHL